MEANQPAQDVNKSPTFITSLSLIYHKIMINLPVILLLLLIALISLTYYLYYLHLMIFSTTYNATTFPFNSTTNITFARTKGIILTTLSSISLILLLISFLRTAFMNPGFYPDPINLEFKIVQKLTYTGFVVDTEKANKRAEFTKNFGSIIDTAPINYSEVVIVSSETILIY